MMPGDQLNIDPMLAPSAAGEGILVRRFRSADRVDVLRLYHEGLLAGRVDPNDRAVDLEDVEGSYFQRPQDHFWIAEANGVVIGTVAISQDHAGVTHLRRLRVAPGWQRDSGVPLHLIRAAVNHARSHGSLLKLVFHTSLDGEEVVKLLNRLGFQFARIRDIGGRHLIEFYDNLYASADLQNSGRDADSLRQ
jgi:ribosomal protein S18 acetylase RimI-like enzyme